MMDENEGDKCVILKGSQVSPCKALYKSSEYGNPRGKQKGIYAWKLINKDTGFTSRVFFGVKSGEHVDNGLAFNFCPFCGEQIDKPHLPKGESKKG